VSNPRAKHSATANAIITALPHSRISSNANPPTESYLWNMINIPKNIPADRTALPRISEIKDVLYCI
jgi:hypothetical protein